MRGKVARAALALLVLVTAVMSSGCWDQRPIEEQAIIIVLGVDINQQNPNLIDVTLGYPLYAESRRAFAKFVTVSAPTFGKAIELWQAGSQLRYAGGKIRLLLVGEEMAKRGLPGFLNYVQLARTDDNAIMAVVRGRAEDFLHAELPETERTGTYTTQLIETAKQLGMGFHSEVYDVMTFYAAPGIDPVMPVLELSAGKDVVTVVGTALFTDLLVAGELTSDETLLLAALMGSSQYILFSPNLGVTGQLESPQPEISLIKPRTRFLPKLEGGHLTVEIEISISYVVRNYYSVTDMTKPDPTEEMTRAFDSNLTIAFQRVLAKLQAARADPLGIGKKLRIKNNQAYDDNSFRDLWEHASVDVQLDLRYMRDGTMVQTQPKQP